MPNLGNAPKMTNPILDSILKEATTRLTAAYGFCGVAMSGSKAILFSMKEEEPPVTITITIKEEAGHGVA